MAYPRGWRRALFRAPIALWRLGLGPLLGRSILILTTTGRRSGRSRRTALEYSIVGGRTYLASGWGLQPDWCKNILADPRVTVQSSVGPVRGRAVRVVADDETLALYHAARGKSPVWSEYLAALGIEDTPEDYLAKKDRVVAWRVDPTDEPTPPPLPADLVWLWLAVGFGLALVTTGTPR